MAEALIVGFALILALCIAGVPLACSHYIYSKNRIFSKTKYSVMWIVIVALMLVFMLITGILFCIYNDQKYAYVYVGISFTCLAFCIGYLIYFLMMPKLTNKNKIGYDQILKVDYQPLIKDVLAKIGSLEQYKKQLSTKHAKYYQELLYAYESILNRAKNSQLSIVEKMADIVTFNDTFTHKWSTFTNYYQIYLSLSFCEILKKIS